MMLIGIRKKISMAAGTKPHQLKGWTFRTILEKITLKITAINPTAGNFTAIQPFSQIFNGVSKLKLKKG